MIAGYHFLTRFNRLREVAQNLGRKAYLVDTADGSRYAVWLQNAVLHHRKAPPDEAASDTVAMSWSARLDTL